jgi:putative ABC transport system permease protein
MLLMIPISYNLRSLMVRRVTTAATALGIGLVVFVFAAMLMLLNSVDSILGASGDPGVAVVISKGSDAELSSTVENDRAGLILEKPEVARDGQGKPLGVAELVVVLTMEKVGAEGVANVTMRGVPENAATFHARIKIVSGRVPKPGTDEVMVGEKIAGRFKGLALGQTFDLRKNRPANVVGIFSAGGAVYESEVWGDVDTMRAAFGRQGVASSVRVRLASASKYEAFETSVEQDKALGLDVLRETEYYEKQSYGLAILIKGLGITIAVFFSLGAMVGAMITMYGSVANRRREIGTLRALGFSQPSILFSFLLEAVVLAMAGGIMGLLASLSMATVKFAVLNPSSWSEVVLRFQPSALMMIGALLFGALMGLLGGFLPAWRAATTSPIEAMRG